jgi:hypothetical protein
MFSRPTQLLDSTTHKQLGAGHRLLTEKLCLAAERRMSAPEVS